MGDIRAALDGAISARQKEAVLRNHVAPLREKVGERSIEVELSASEDPTYYGKRRNRPSELNTATSSTATRQ